MDSNDEKFMREAILLARIALECGDNPVGSVVVSKEHVVGEGIESVWREKDLAAHAELRSITGTCRRLDAFHLDCCKLYTTVEPCFMRSFLIRSAHISRVIIGKAVPYIGGITSHYPVLIDSEISTWLARPVVVSGVLEKECQELFAR